MYICLCVYIGTYIEKHFYYKALTHVITEAVKSQKLRGESASCRLRRAYGEVPIPRPRLETQKESMLQFKKKGKKKPMF